MKDFNLKFRIIYLPFLVLYFGFIATYSLCYVLLTQKNILNVNEGIIDYLLPVALSGILSIWIMHKRFMLLKWKSAIESHAYNHTFLCFLAISVTTIFTVQYVKNVSHPLTFLQNISEINTHPGAKYVTLKNAQQHFLDKSKASGLEYKRYITSRSGSHYNFYAAFMSPLYDSIVEDSLQPVPNTWLVVEFYKNCKKSEVPSGTSKQKLEEYYDSCWAEYDARSYMDFTYLERMGKTNEYEKYIRQLADNKNADVKNIILLTPVFEPFEKRGRLMLIFTCCCFGLFTATGLLLLFFAHVQDDKVTDYLEGKPIKGETETGIVYAFMPRPAYLVTPFLLFMNCAVAALLVTSVSLTPTVYELYLWGANYGPSTLHGEWWRLITSLFLHEDVYFFIYGLLILFGTGNFLERVIGSALFAVLFFTGGIITGLVDIYYYPTSDSWGFNGPVFSLFGTLSVLAIRQLKRGGVNLYMAIPIGTVALLGACYGMDFDFQQNLAGVIWGVIFGLAIIPWLNKTGRDFDTLGDKEKKRKKAEAAVSSAPPEFSE